MRYVRVAHALPLMMSPSDAIRQAQAESRFFSHRTALAVATTVLLGVNLGLGGALWAAWVGARAGARRLAATEGALRPPAAPTRSTSAPHGSALVETPRLDGPPRR